MRRDILIISDIHGNKYNIEALKEETSPDYLLILGDITTFGTLDEALEILEEASSLANVSGYFVPGNCDPFELFKINSVGKLYNVHGKCKEDRELRACIYGLGGQDLTENTFEGVLKNRDCKGLKILISHRPPYGTKIDKLVWGGHAGHEDIARLVSILNPKLVFSGHIHEGRGVDKAGDMILVNPGPLEEGYYAICILSKEEIDVKLCRIY